MIFFLIRPFQKNRKRIGCETNVSDKVNEKNNKKRPDDDDYDDDDNDDDDNEVPYTSSV